MLWEHRGVTQLDQDLSEGALSPCVMHPHGFRIYPCTRAASLLLSGTEIVCIVVACIKHDSHSGHCVLCTVLA